VHQLSDGSVVVATTADTQAHIRGERDPNSGEPLSCDFEAALHNLKPGLLTHGHRMHTGVPGVVLSKHNSKDCGIYRFPDVYHCTWWYFIGRATRCLRAGLQQPKERGTAHPCRPLTEQGLMPAQIESKYCMGPRVISRRLMSDPSVQHTQEPIPPLKLLQELDEQHEARNSSADQDAIIY
jgi:hypothetical protein